MLLKALDGYVRTVGKGHPRIQTTGLALATAYAAQDKRDAAVSLLQGYGMLRRSGDGLGAEAAHSATSSTPPEQSSVVANNQRAAFEAVLAATSHDDLYTALERFAFITSTGFISRLESLAAKHSSDFRGALLERAALLRHLAAGKPLNAECNPVSEAFAAIRQATSPGDERMLLRLYPFLQSAQILQEMRRMVAQVPDGIAVDMVARIAQCVRAENSQSVDVSTE